MNIPFLNSLRKPSAKRCLAGDAVKLYWFSGRNNQNLGDVISPIIVSHFTGREVARAEKRDSPKMLAVGSVLNQARAGDVVWGTGFIGGNSTLRSKNILVTAVRGPLTRARLLSEGVDCPECYGDPAILLPLIHPPGKAAEERKRVGFIPHYSDRDIPLPCDPAFKVIDILSPPELFLEELISCERVVSSSLHGVIIAESYGIAADWMMLSDKVVGGKFKFHDYYLSTDREAPEPLAAGELLVEREWLKPTFRRDELLAALPIKPAATI